MQELSPYNCASQPPCITHRPSYNAAASSTPGHGRPLSQSYPYNAKACPGNSSVPGPSGGTFYPENNTFRSEPHILKVFLTKPGNS